MPFRVTASVTTLLLLVTNLSSSMASTVQNINLDLSRDTLMDIKKNPSAFKDYFLSSNKMTSTANGGSTRNLKKKNKFPDECRQDETLQMIWKDLIDLVIQSGSSDIATDFAGSGNCQVTDDTVYCPEPDDPDDVEDCETKGDQWITASITVEDFDDGKTLVMTGGNCLPRNCNAKRFAKLMSSMITVKTNKKG